VNFTSFGGFRQGLSHVFRVNDIFMVKIFSPLVPLARFDKVKLISLTKYVISRH
jgi:hypothetical protein